MNITRALKLRDAAKVRINDLFRHAAFYGTPHAVMLESRAAIYADLAKAPRWVTAYLEGIWTCHMDYMYRDHLVHGFMHEGRFHSTHSKRDDYYGKQGLTPEQASNLLQTVESGHYWNTRSYGMKPFFTSVV